MEKIQEDKCRLCLQIFPDMEDINNYTEAIEISTGIKVAKELGNFPKKICFDCLSTVFRIRNFKEKCLKNNNWLHEKYPRTAQQNKKEETKSEIKEVLEVHQDESVQNNDSKDESIQNNITKDEINYESLEPENDIWGTDRHSSTTSSDEAFPLPDYDDKVIPKVKEKRKDTGKKRGPYKKKTKCIDGILADNNDGITKEKKLEKNTDKKREPLKKKQIPKEKSIEKEKKKKKNYHKLFPCHICGKLHTKLRMKFHLNMHNDIRPFICEFPDCGKGFYSLYQQRSHFKKVHTSFSLYQCETCGKRFKTRRAYEIHCSYHFDPKLPCNVCGKLLRNKVAVKKHMLVHTDERNYKCEICSKGFQTRYTWKVHQRIHTKEKPYKCIRCDQGFTYNCLLKAHIEKYHTEITDDKS